MRARRGDREGGAPLKPEDLANLACQAIDDPSARIVFTDAIYELGIEASVSGSSDNSSILVQIGKERWTLSLLPLSPYRRDRDGLLWPAIAAALLFGKWARKMWPAAARCKIRKRRAKPAPPYWRAVYSALPWTVAEVERSKSQAEGTTPAAPDPVPGAYDEISFAASKRVNPG